MPRKRLDDNVMIKIQSRIVAPVQYSGLTQFPVDESGNVIPSVYVVEFYVYYKGTKHSKTKQYDFEFPAGIVKKIVIAGDFDTINHYSHNSDTPTTWNDSSLTLVGKTATYEKYVDGVLVLSTPVTSALTINRDLLDPAIKPNNQMIQGSYSVLFEAYHTDGDGDTIYGVKEQIVLVKEMKTPSCVDARNGQTVTLGDTDYDIICGSANRWELIWEPETLNPLQIVISDPNDPASFPTIQEMQGENVKAFLKDLLENKEYELQYIQKEPDPAFPNEMYDSPTMRTYKYEAINLTTSDEVILKSAELVVLNKILQRDIKFISPELRPMVYREVLWEPTSLTSSIVAQDHQSASMTSAVDLMQNVRAYYLDEQNLEQDLTVTLKRPEEASYNNPIPLWFHSNGEVKTHIPSTWDINYTATVDGYSTATQRFASITSKKTKKFIIEDTIAPVVTTSNGLSWPPSHLEYGMSYAAYSDLWDTTCVGYRCKPKIYGLDYPRFNFSWGQAPVYPYRNFPVVLRTLHITENREITQQEFEALQHGDSFRMEATVTDDSGNTNFPNIETIQCIDTTVPSLVVNTLALPISNQAPSQQVLLSGTTTFDLSSPVNLTYDINGIDWNTPGIASVVYTATDAIGLQTTISRTIIIYNPSLIPTGGANPPPPNGSPPPIVCGDTVPALTLYGIEIISQLVDTDWTSTFYTLDDKGNQVVVEYVVHTDSIQWIEGNATDLDGTLIHSSVGLTPYYFNIDVYYQGYFIHCVTRYIEIQDAIAPTITLPANPIQISVTALSDVAYIEDQLKSLLIISDDFSALENITFTIDGLTGAEAVTAGSYIKTVRAQDEAGNFTDLSVTFTLIANDADGDGIVDSRDEFPNDGSVTTDIDGDGIGDDDTIVLWHHDFANTLSYLSIRESEINVSQTLNTEAQQAVYAQVVSSASPTQNLSVRMVDGFHLSTNNVDSTPVLIGDTSLSFTLALEPAFAIDNTDTGMFILFDGSNGGSETDGRLEIKIKKLQHITTTDISYRFSVYNIKNGLNTSTIYDDTKYSNAASQTSLGVVPSPSLYFDGSSASSQIGTNTVSNATISTDNGKYDSSFFDFGATGNLAPVRIGDDIDLSSGTYTFSLWFYNKRAVGDWGGVLRQTSGTTPSSTANYPIITSNTNNNLGLYKGGFYGTGYHMTSLEGNPGWTHLAVVADGSTSTFYVDGVQAGTPINQVITTSVGELGAYDGIDAQVFAEGIDEFAYWNAALSAAEILVIKNSTEKLSEITGDATNSSLAFLDATDMSNHTVLNDVGATELYLGAGSVSGYEIEKYITNFDLPIDSLLHAYTFAFEKRTDVPNGYQFAIYANGELKQLLFKNNTGGLGISTDPVTYNLYGFDNMLMSDYIWSTMTDANDVINIHEKLLTTTYPVSTLSGDTDGDGLTNLTEDLLGSEFDKTISNTDADTYTDYPDVTDDYIEHYFTHFLSPVANVSEPTHTPQVSGTLEDFSQDIFVNYFIKGTYFGPTVHLLSGTTSQTMAFWWLNDGSLPDDGSIFSDPDAVDWPGLGWNVSSFQSKNNSGSTTANGTMTNFASTYNSLATSEGVLWKHFAITLNPIDGEAKIYINGILKDTITGYTGGGSKRLLWDGPMKWTDFVVWNDIEFPQSKITQIYNTGKDLEYDLRNEYPAIVADSAPLITGFNYENVTTDYTDELLKAGLTTTTPIAEQLPTTVVVNKYQLDAAISNIESTPGTYEIVVETTTNQGIKTYTRREVAVMDVLKGFVEELPFMPMPTQIGTYAGIDFLETDTSLPYPGIVTVPATHFNHIVDTYTISFWFLKTNESSGTHVEGAGIKIWLWHGGTILSMYTGLKPQNTYGHVKRESFFGNNSNWQHCVITVSTDQTGETSTKVYKNSTLFVNGLDAPTTVYTKDHDVVWSGDFVVSPQQGMNLDSFEIVDYSLSTTGITNLYTAGRGTLISESGISSGLEQDAGTTLYGNAVIVNGVLELDGVGDYAEVHDNFRYTDMITVSVWFQSTGIGDQRIYSSHVRQAGNNGFFARLDAGTLRMRAPDGGVGELVLTSGLNDGEWHHLVMSWEASTTNGRNIYLDGSLINTANGGTANGYNPSFGLLVGANPWSGNLPYAHLNGKIVGFKVLNEAMTALEVETEYNTTAPT